MSRKELQLAVGTALLSFLGAMLGVYFSSHFDQLNWERRFELEQKRLLLEKRASLIERTVVLFNKSPTVIGLRASLDAEKQYALMAAECSKRNSATGNDCNSSPKVDMAHVENSAKEIHTLNAEFSATMTMNAIYFGPETKQATQVFNGIDPWEASTSMKQTLVDAMARELNWVPKNP